VLENLPNMVFVKDAEELRFVRFNRAGEKLIGSPREELIGKNDHDLFPNKGARARRRGQQVVRTGASARPVTVLAVKGPLEKLSARRDHLLTPTHGSFARCATTDRSSSAGRWRSTRLLALDELDPAGVVIAHASRCSSPPHAP
jgi:PAS domain-containing protein